MSSLSIENIIPNTYAAINYLWRKIRVFRHNRHYQKLHAELNRSQDDVKHTKAGYVRERPVSAPERSRYHTPSSLNSDPSKPKSVMQLAGRWIRHCYDMDNIRNPREPSPPPPAPPSPTLYQRPHTAPVVTASHRMSMEDHVNALRFEIQTLEYKYRQILNDDLDFLLPGYREWRELNPKQPPTPPPKPRPPREQIPSERTLRRLCYHQSPAVPPPAHAKGCDARMRGWHSTRTRRGHHYVLSRTTSGNMIPGRLLAKQGLASCFPQGDRTGQYIHRHTRKRDVIPDKPRPATVPSVMKRHRALHDRRSTKPPPHNVQGQEGRSGTRSASPAVQAARSRSQIREQEAGGEDSKEEARRHDVPGRVSSGHQRKDIELVRVDVNEEESEYDEEEEEDDSEEKFAVSEPSKESLVKNVKRSESSSETLDFNFLTAKVQKGNRTTLGPKFLTPQTPPTPPSILQASDQLFKSDRDRQVKFESESETGTESDYSESESEEETVPEKPVPPKPSIDERKTGSVAVLEEIKESEEPESTTVATNEELDEVDRELDRVVGGQDVESSASKLWPKQMATPSPSLKLNLLSHLDDETHQRKSSPTCSEISTSLTVRTNPHTEIVRALSAKRRPVRSPSPRRRQSKDYPAAGETGVVVLQVPRSWENHPWIMEMLKEETESQKQQKAYRRLIKRGQGQISPRLKRKFEMGVAY